MSRAARTPFLAIGHTARDLFPDGRWRLGGSALYGAATAAKLGAAVTLVTRAGPTERDALETLCQELGIALRVLPGDVTTTFAFTYDTTGHRTLRLRAKAAPITRADVGRAVTAPKAVLLASIAGELDASLFAPWSGAKRVLAAQGLLRSFGADGTVIATAWMDYARLLPKVDAVVVSEDDHAEDSAWLPYTTVVVTQAERGSDLHARGATTHVRAFAVPAVIDQTGAGDAFAAGLALGLADGLPLIEAATFASAAASFAVEGLGMSRLADRARVRERMGELSVEWAALDRGAAALDGSAGLIVLDADGTVRYEREADESYPAASVIKVPILMTVYADAAEGRLSLDERIGVGEHMPGTGVLGHVPGVADLTIRDHATLMTIVSDNTSTNRLMERLGVDRIAERMREWGCVRTELRRKMFDFEAANRGLDNVASPREMAGLLLRLVRGELVDRATSDAVLAVLEATQDDALIRRYLPARTKVAHKTGSLDKVRNDAAVIWAERPVVTVGFVNGVPDIRPARSLLGLLGWLAYGAAGGDAEGLPSEWPQAR